jgi:hypothetical protein
VIEKAAIGGIEPSAAQIEAAAKTPVIVVSQAKGNTTI